MSKISTAEESVLDAYLECRLFGHAWTLDGRSKHQPRYGEVSHCINLRCLRCTTKRHDVFTIRGHLNYRTYEYPDDYAIPAEETPSREQLRKRFYEERVMS